MHHAKQLGTLQFYKQLMKQLTPEDLESVKVWCHKGIDRYFGEHTDDNQHPLSIAGMP